MCFSLSWWRNTSIWVPSAQQAITCWHSHQDSYSISFMTGESDAWGKTLNVEAAWRALVITKQSLATPKNIFTSNAFNQHDPEQKSIASVKYFYRWKLFLLSLLWWIVIAPPTLPYPISTLQYIFTSNYHSLVFTCFSRKTVVQLGVLPICAGNTGA